jgi:hypothetical protein
VIRDWFKPDAGLPKHLFVVVQETRATAQAQQLLTADFRQEGLEVALGAPVNLGYARSARTPSIWAGARAGVALVARAGMRVRTVPAERLRKHGLGGLYADGRVGHWMIALARDDRKARTQEWLHVVAFYGRQTFARAERELAERDLQALAAYVLGLGEVAVVVAADWNMHLDTSPTWQFLNAEQGWEDLAESFDQALPTFRRRATENSDEVATRPDGCACNMLARRLVETFAVLEDEWFPEHATLQIGLRGAPADELIGVHRPPQAWRRHSAWVEEQAVAYLADAATALDDRAAGRLRDAGPAGAWDAWADGVDAQLRVLARPPGTGDKRATGGARRRASSAVPCRRADMSGGA